jgi:magnesium transporter
VVQMIADSTSTDTEQVSIFLGDRFVLSFQEQPGDCFDLVRARIHNDTSRLRSRGADYLAYALIDAVTDGYFPVLERLGEDLEDLEDAIVSDPQPESARMLHDLKRQFLSLRRAVWPHRELLSTLTRDEHGLLQRETRLYLRDCYDHAVQLMDLLETYREIASGLMDVYASSVNVKLSEIMKVLTVIATVFMPLGFIASLYGMNFDRTASAWNMPELGWRFGYLFSLGLMAGCVVFLLYYFRRRGWLNRSRRPKRRSPE